jgi:ankyrin repeat protein
MGNCSPTSASRSFSPTNLSDYSLHDPKIPLRELRRILEHEPYRINELSRVMRLVPNDGTGDDMCAPLHVAVMYERLDLLEELLRRGADINVVSEV